MYTTDSAPRFDNIRFHPNGRQFFNDELSAIILTPALIILSGYEGRPGGTLRVVLFVVGLLGMFYLAFRFFYIKRMWYCVTSDQLTHEHGVFSVQRDYIELYRVFDYGESQSFLQRMLGIKTITIYSGDRTCPRLCIIGIDEHMDLIYEIRKRVEYNKLRHNIHEFTNAK